MADKAWRDTLQTAALALGGSGVGLWVADDARRLRPLMESADPPALGPATRELRAVLHQWQVPMRVGDRWVASRSGHRRWCVARVRTTWPARSLPSVERRGVTRRLLDVAGVCIGALDATGDPNEQAWSELPAALQEVTPDGTIVRANRAQLALVGLAAEDYVGRQVADVYGDRDVVDAVLRLVRTGEVRDVRAEVQCGDGTRRPVLFSAGAVLEKGRTARSCWVTQAIPSTVRYVQAIVDSADDAIIGSTLDGALTYWNPAAERLFGYAAAEVLGKSAGILIPPERAAELPDVLAQVAKGERVRHDEATGVRKDGSRVDVSVSVSPIYGEGGEPIGASAVARDIVERRRAEEELRHGALHDPLTELPNRALLAEHVAQALERARADAGYRFAVLYLDLDDFKLVNDSLGHGAGDLLLVEVAARLRRALRPADLVARMGGDEFTAVLEDVTSLADVQQAGRRIRRSLDAPLVIDGRELRVTASIGAALATGSYANADDLLRDADLAMYHAKRRGHGYLELFHPTMRESAHARFRLRTDLGAALDRGELALAFQPIVDLRSGRPVAFEALLRWQHGERGSVPPPDFIPVAEATGLIIPIGAWVLRHACQAAVEWQRVSPSPVGVSVNISPRQLGHSGFADQVRRCLTETGLDPRLLRLEITETDLLAKGDLSIKVLGQLRALGVELHVDDFGTGYSSLSYLPQFPLQAIKVDRAFVHRMGARRTDHEIVRSIVDLARTLGLGVIAEGVETVAQRERLIAFGCELGQGFLFARPMEGSRVAAYLRADDKPSP